MIPLEHAACCSLMPDQAPELCPLAPGCCLYSVPEPGPLKVPHRWEALLSCIAMQNQGTVSPCASEIKVLLDSALRKETVV